MFVVYAIESCLNQRLYIGQTQDIETRLGLHNKGLVKSTVNDRPWKLVAMERFDTREDARWREHQLKLSRGRRLKWQENHKF